MKNILILIYSFLFLSACVVEQKTSDVDPELPVITISSPSNFIQDTRSVKYRISFSKSKVVQLALSHISVVRTGSLEAATQINYVSETERDVEFKGISGSGSISFKITSGAALSKLNKPSKPTDYSEAYYASNSPAVVNISAPSSSITLNSNVTYTISFSNASSAPFSISQVVLNKTGTANGTLALTGTGLSNRTLTITNISGAGTLSVTIQSGAALNIYNIPSNAVTSSAFTVDNSPPTISVDVPTPAALQSGSATYQVNYTDAQAILLDMSFLTLNKTGTANGTISSVTGSGTSNRTVTITGISGDGYLSLSIAKDSAYDSNGLLSAAYTPSPLLIVDNTPPSIAISSPSTSLANTGPVTFTITYTGASSITLSNSDITLNKTGTANATVSVSGTGILTRTVTLSGITGDGTLGISIGAGTAVDLAGNSALSTSASSTFTVDNTLPLVTISSPSASITKNTNVTYTVSFTGADTIQLTTLKVSLTKTGTANGSYSITGSGSTRTVTVSGISGDGTIAINIAAAAALDNAGNQSLAVGPSTSFTVDNTPPSIAISAPSPTTATTGPVSYTVTYTGASTIYLDSSYITVTKTGTANASVAVTGSGSTTRTVTFSSITGDGYISFSINNLSAVDSVGNYSTATSTSSTFAVGNTPCTLSISAPSASSATSGPITYTLTYNAATSVTLANGDISLNKTGSASATVAVSGSGLSTRTVTLSSISGNGSLGISVAANTAANIIGTQCGAQGPSTTFSVTNDPLYQYAWHLNNTGQTNFATNAGTSGFDLNVLGVWAQGITGNGVKILVSDTGIDSDHEDLNANFLTGTVSIDFINGVSPNYLYATAKPKYIADSIQAHGTEVAGIISAVGSNSKGSLGIAYGAKLASSNFLNAVSPGITEQLAQVAGTFDVFNQSYGYPQCYDISEDTTYESQLATDRKKYIKAAGNDFDLDISKCSRTSVMRHGNSNLDPYNTNPYTIIVAALNATGVKSSYSSLGSNVWISGFGGEYGNTDPAIMTTDMIGCSEGTSPLAAYNSFQSANAENPSCHYTSIMNGTSAATPTISGVVALMLEANPSLTTRDVKHILASTAKQNDATDSNNSNAYGASPSGHSWEQGWITNGAGFKFNNKYGFGQVDALAAVNMAKTGYTLLTAEYQSGYTSSGVLSLAIPDNSSTGVTNTISFGTSKTIEAIQIKVSMTHTYAGDVGIELTSPAGTKSIIMHVNNSLTDIANLTNKQFLTNAFYGENSSGNWTIKLIDGSAGDTGTLTEWQLNVIGH